jgi:hypothetical protein
MDDKLDKIRDDISIGKIESTLEVNTLEVAKHIKRSDNYEDEIQKLKSEVLPLLPEIKQMIKYWKLLSVVVIVAVTASNPAIIPILLKYLGVPTP